MLCKCCVNVVVIRKLLNPPQTQAWTRRLPRRRLSLKLNGLVSETRSVTDNRNRCDARYFESPIQMSQRGRCERRDRITASQASTQVAGRVRVQCHVWPLTDLPTPALRPVGRRRRFADRRYPSDWNKTGTGGVERIFASVLSSEYSDKSILKLPTRPRLALALPV